MHYYNRDLPVVEDSAFYLGPDAQTPYTANSQEYRGNIVSRAFCDNMLRNLGPDTIYVV